MREKKINADNHHPPKEPFSHEPETWSISAAGDLLIIIFITPIYQLSSRTHDTLLYETPSKNIFHTLEWWYGIANEASRSINKWAGRNIFFDFWSYEPKEEPRWQPEKKAVKILLEGDRWLLGDCRRWHGIRQFATSEPSHHIGPNTIQIFDRALLQH